MGENLRNYHTVERIAPFSTLWTRDIQTEKIFRQFNSLVISLIKTTTLFSRKIWQESVRVLKLQCT